MKRADLSFVISRALSIWLFVEALKVGLGMIQVLGSMDKNSGPYMLQVAGMGCLSLGFAWLLWFHPLALAGGKETTNAAVAGPTEIRDGLYSAVGLYFVCLGAITLIGQVAARGFAEPLSEVFKPNMAAPIAEIVIGGAVILYTRRSMLEAVNRAWSVGDPEEMKEP